MKLARCAIVLTMAGTFCVSVTALAAEPKTTNDSSKTQPAAKSAHMNALRVVRDAETGELRAPTSEELQALIAAEQAARQTTLRSAARSSTQYAPEVMPAEKSIKRHANGMLSMQLSQESLTAIKAVPDASGKMHVVHVDELPQAAAQEK